MATTSQPALKYWHSELVKALTAAKVDEKFCTKLMCQYKQYLEIGELLADALSNYIQIGRPDKLEFNIPVHIARPVAQLRLFLLEVQQHHEGVLVLKFHHSYFNYAACGDAIEALTGAR